MPPDPAHPSHGPRNCPANTRPAQEHHGPPPTPWGNQPGRRTAGCTRHEPDTPPAAPPPRTTHARSSPGRCPAPARAARQAPPGPGQPPSPPSLDPQGLARPPGTASQVHRRPSLAGAEQFARPQKERARPATDCPRVILLPPRRYFAVAGRTTTHRCHKRHPPARAAPPAGDSPNGPSPNDDSRYELLDGVLVVSPRPTCISSRPSSSGRSLTTRAPKISASCSSQPCS